MQAIGEKRALPVIALAAREKMRAAGYVEEETMRKIERDQRRIAIAPVGDLLQKRTVGNFVGLLDHKVGDGAACIGKRQTGTESSQLGILVESNDPHCILDLRDDGKRRRRLLTRRA
jgi:hypothetical protein